MRRPLPLSPLRLDKRSAVWSQQDSTFRLGTRPPLQGRWVQELLHDPSSGTHRYTYQWVQSGRQTGSSTLEYTCYNLLRFVVH